MKIVRNLYNWVLTWSDRPNGPRVLGILSIAEASFFPIPPDVLFFNHIPGFTIDGFYRIQALYEHWNFWIVFTAGFTPIPFKLFTISAGAFNIHFPMFILGSIISRSARFFLIACLVRIFGEPILDFIDRYFIDHVKTFLLNILFRIIW